MDISKASNFERFVYDLLGRDGVRTRQLFKTDVEDHGSFTLSAEEFKRIQNHGFVSGRSTHADRLATIRDTWQRFGVMIDTHTADGLKVAREHAEPGVPMIVLETALPAKFADTIVEAIGRQPDRPAATVGIEQLPKRFKVMRVDAEAVKAFIAENA
jgi:threonine synthase